MSNRCDGTIPAIRNFLVVGFASLLSLSGCTTPTPPTKDNLNEPDAVSGFRDAKLDSVKDIGSFGLVVSISGGGIRASNLGIGMLLALDSIKVPQPSLEAELDTNGINSKQPSLLNELDYASTVSGGGLGVAVYLTSMLSTDCNQKTDRGFYYKLMDDKDSRKKLNLLSKSWAPAGFSMVNPATWNRTVTRANIFERDYFSKFSEITCNGAVSTVSLDTAESNQYFSHIMNATISTDGRIFPLSIDHLAKLRVNGYIGNDLNWVDIENTLNPAEEIPYHIGLSASAAFPPVLPDTRLRRNSRNEANSYIHLTDGGQADDNGLETSLKIVKQLSDKKMGTPILYLALDALPGEGYIQSEDVKPQDAVMTLIERNMDLPRYGSKRDLSETIYGDISQSKTSRLDNMGTEVYAAHMGLWRYETYDKKLTEAAKISTIKAGRRGLYDDEQQATIVAGALMTYRALLGVETTDSEIYSVVQAVASCLVEPVQEQCVNPDDNPWKRLEKYIATVQSSSDRKPLTQDASQLEIGTPIIAPFGLVEFAKNTKIEEWDSRLSDQAEDLQKLNDHVIEQTKIAIETVESSKKTIDDNFSVKINATWDLTNALLDQFTPVFNEAAKDYVEENQKVVENNLEMTKSIIEADDAINSIFSENSKKSEMVRNGDCSCNAKLSCKDTEINISEYNLLNPDPDKASCSFPTLPKYIVSNSGMLSIVSSKLKTGIDDLVVYFANSSSETPFSDAARNFSLFVKSENEIMRIGNQRLEQVEDGITHRKSEESMSNLVVHKALWVDLIQQQDSIAKSGFQLMRAKKSPGTPPSNEDDSEQELTISITVSDVLSTLADRREALSKTNGCLIQSRSETSNILNPLMKRVSDKSTQTSEALATLQSDVSACSGTLWNHERGLTAGKTDNFLECGNWIAKSSEAFRKLRETTQSLSFTDSDSIPITPSVYADQYIELKDCGIEISNADISENRLSEKKSEMCDRGSELLALNCQITEPFENYISTLNAIQVAAHTLHVDRVNTFSNEAEMIYGSDNAPLVKCYDERRVVNFSEYMNLISSRKENGESTSICEY